MEELPYQSLPDRPYYEGAETHYVGQHEILFEKTLT